MLKSDTLAIDWCLPDSLPVSSLKEDYPPDEITFNTQTSVIKAQYSFATMNYSIKIKHNGHESEFHIAGEVIHHHSDQEVVKLIWDETKAYWKDDAKVPLQLVEKFYEIQATPWLATGGYISATAAKQMLEEMDKSDYYKNLYMTSPQLTPYPYSIETHMYTPTYSDTRTELSMLAKQLPGVKEYVTHPVTKRYETLYHAIIDLNDNHRWPREDIADWIESLDIDTEFKEKI